MRITYITAGAACMFCGSCMRDKSLVVALGQLGVPFLCSLQGDDIYLDSLPELAKSRCLELIRAHCRKMDGFLATSRYYAHCMSGYFAIPRAKIPVVHPGLNLARHGGERPGH